MSDEKHTAWDDAHSLGIALRLAHAQNRDLRKQLAATTKALEEVAYATHFNPCRMKDIAKQALAAIKPNQGEHP